MFNFSTLDVAIGMAMIYLLLALFCSAINEGIAGILGSRAKNLEKGIRSIFTGGKKEITGGSNDGKGLQDLAAAIYDHGLVQSLYKSEEKEQRSVWSRITGNYLPSYIPSNIFVTALFDVLFPLTPDPNTNNPKELPRDLNAMLAMARRLPDSKGKEAIVSLIRQANGNLDETRKIFERWYDDCMERVSGWYKRKTQLVVFIIGLTISIFLNVDSISIAKSLWSNPALRAYAVTAAEKYANSQLDSISADDVSKQLETLQSRALPIGWKRDIDHSPIQSHEGKMSISWEGLLISTTGWLLTAIAMTFGAPFWFDLLNQFMVVRSTIKPQEKSKAEGSKDAK